MRSSHKASARCGCVRRARRVRVFRGRRPRPVLQLRRRHRQHHQQPGHDRHRRHADALPGGTRLRRETRSCPASSGTCPALGTSTPARPCASRPRQNNKPPTTRTFRRTRPPRNWPPATGDVHDDGAGRTSPTSPTPTAPANNDNMVFGQVVRAAAPPTTSSSTTASAATASTRATGARTRSGRARTLPPTPGPRRLRLQRQQHDAVPQRRLRSRRTRPSGGFLTTTPKTRCYNMNNITIGKTATGNNGNFNGILDEVKMFDTALTAAQIAAGGVRVRARAGVPGPAGPRCRWPAVPPQAAASRPSRATLPSTQRQKRAGPPWRAGPLALERTPYATRAEAPWLP